MKENESEIQELIGELQVIEMCKDYCDEVKDQIKVEESKCLKIQAQFDHILNEIKSLEKGSDGNIFNFSRGKDERKWESLQEGSKTLILEMDECDQIIQILKFELSILNKKVERENQLRPELNALVLRREKNIRSSGSRNFRKLLYLKDFGLSGKIKK